MPSALRFEENLGQFDARVRFVARVRGGALLLADDGATLEVGARQGGVTFRVAGGRPVVPRGGDLVATRTNYFVGERARWRTNVPNFGQVTYASVRAGIDVVYHGEAGALEYDVLVAPQADPADAVIEVGGSDGLAITPDGGLVIRTPRGSILQAPPRVYQTLDGRRQEVRGAYRLVGERAVGFVVARYDRTRLLVIDPVLSYATYLDAEYAQAVAVDGTGHAYVAGYTSSVGLGTSGAVQPSYAGNDDAYVAKLDPSGTSLVYASYLGGTDVDRANGIAVDATGHAYVTGKTQSTDYPTTAGSLKPTSTGGDAFVTELAPDGASLVYSTYLGGGGTDEGLAIAVDSAGRADVTGITSSEDFPHSSGLYAFGGTSTSVSVSNAFVASIAAGGGSLVYSTCLGNAANGDYSTARGNAIAVDAAGNAYVTGYADPTGFPLENPLSPFSVLSNLFVTEVAAGGGSLVFSTFIVPAAGGNGGEGIAVDSSNNVYVTGPALSSFATTANAAQTSCPQSGGGCSFVEKLAPSGASVVYATVVGGSAGALTTAIAVDGAGTAYVTGSTSSSDFPLVSALSGPTATFQSLGTDAFVTAIDKTGGSYDYSTHFNQEIGAAIAVDGAGNAYVAGSGASVPFATCGALQTGPQGLVSAFVLRIARDGQGDAGPAVCGPEDGGGLDAGGLDGASSPDGAADVDAAASEGASPPADDAGAASAPPDDAGVPQGTGATPAGDAGSPSPGSSSASGCQVSTSRYPGGATPWLLGAGLAVVLFRRGSKRRA